MSDAKYLGFTANRLAKSATNLERENAKLRDEIKRRDELEAKLIRCIENDYGIVFAWDPLRKVWLSSCTDEYVTERERLDAENAKLRELVIEVFNCARRGAICETCKVNNDGYACVYIMHELGVEVDQ